MHVAQLLPLYATDELVAFIDAQPVGTFFPGHALLQFLLSVLGDTLLNEVLGAPDNPLHAFSPWAELALYG